MNLDLHLKKPWPKMGTYKLSKIISFIKLANINIVVKHSYKKICKKFLIALSA